MEDQKVLVAIAQFLQRVELKGTEVPAYNKCMEYLYERIDDLNKQPGDDDAS